MTDDAALCPEVRELAGAAVVDTGGLVYDIADLVRCRERTLALAPAGQKRVLVHLIALVAKLRRINEAATVNGRIQLVALATVLGCAATQFAAEVDVLASERFASEQRRLTPRPALVTGLQAPTATRRNSYYK